MPFKRSAGIETPDGGNSLFHSAASLNDQRSVAPQRKVIPSKDPRWPGADDNGSILQRFGPLNRIIETCRIPDINVGEALAGNPLLCIERNFDSDCVDEFQPVFLPGVEALPQDPVARQIAGLYSEIQTQRGRQLGLRTLDRQLKIGNAERHSG